MDVSMGCLLLQLYTDLPGGLAEMWPWSYIVLVVLQMKTNWPNQMGSYPPLFGTPKQGLFTA